MPNIGRKAKAKSIGTLKRILPPTRLRIKQVRTATEGTEMIIVVIRKKFERLADMPETNMWCAQTMKDRIAIEAVAYTIEL